MGIERTYMPESGALWGEYYSPTQPYTEDPEKAVVKGSVLGLHLKTSLGPSVNPEQTDTS